MLLIYYILLLYDKKNEILEIIHIELKIIKKNYT